MLYFLRKNYPKATNIHQEKQITQPVMSYFLNTAEILQQAIHRISWARLGMTLIAFRDRSGTEILVHSACS